MPRGALYLRLDQILPSRWWCDDDVPNPLIGILARVGIGLGAIFVRISEGILRKQQDSEMQRGGVDLTSPHLADPRCIALRVSTFDTYVFLVLHILACLAAVPSYYSKGSGRPVVASYCANQWPCRNLPRRPVTSS